MRTSDGTVVVIPSPEVVAERAEAYENWTGRVSTPIAEGGHGTVVTRAEPLGWTPLSRPLSDCRVALVSTGGVHLARQEPFDAFSHDGDPTVRVIPGDVDTAELTVSHIHYPTDDALEDINVMFPLDRLRELADDGTIEAVSSVHLGLMGFLPDPSGLLTGALPSAVDELHDADVDVVLLTAG